MPVDLRSVQLGADTHSREPSTLGGKHDQYYTFKWHALYEHITYLCRLRHIIPRIRVEWEVSPDDFAEHLALALASGLKGVVPSKKDKNNNTDAPHVHRLTVGWAVRVWDVSHSEGVGMVVDVLVMMEVIDWALFSQSGVLDKKTRFHKR